MQRGVGPRMGLILPPSDAKISGNTSVFHVPYSTHALPEAALIHATEDSSEVKCPRVAPQIVSPHNRIFLPFIFLKINKF